MRKGFAGLYGWVRDRLQCEPLSGHGLRFTNARHNRLKRMVFEGSGRWVGAKRLEKGCCRWPEPSAGQAKIVLTHEELTMLLGGIDLGQARRRPWYRKANDKASKHARITA
jgi:transposase